MEHGLRVVNLKLSLYVDSRLSLDEVVDYLNDQLHCDPDFFGEIDTGCVTLTKNIEPDVNCTV